MVVWYIPGRDTSLLVCPKDLYLALCLFLYYINDMPDEITSIVRLFADDTIMYLAFLNDSDTITLQRDLVEWETKWQMQLHPGKCQVLTIIRNHTIIQHDYILHGDVLEHVKEAKYFGVTLTSDLRWNRHIVNVSTKANRTLSFLRRNLQIKAPLMKITVFNTLVRPIVEVTPAVWDPYTVGNICTLEKVQRRATRYVLNRFHNHSSVTDMLTEIGWTSLEECRKHQQLLMLCRIRNGLVAINSTHTSPPLSVVLNYMVTAKGDQVLPRIELLHGIALQPLSS